MQKRKQKTRFLAHFTHFGVKHNFPQNYVLTIFFSILTMNHCAKFQNKTLKDVFSTTLASERCTREWTSMNL